MKSLMKHATRAILPLVGALAMMSCHDDKDINVINEELPLKVAHLYMVGDATPTGWSIDNPTELTRDANDQFIFTYHGKLNVGEMKFPLTKGDWGATFIYAPTAGTEISEKGVAQPGLDVRKGGNDTKWKVTQAGIYTLTLNLREYKISATYEGAEPITPIASKTLGFIGDATPAGWSDVAATMFTKTSDTPLQFTYEGHLKTGEFKLTYDGTVLKKYAGPYILAPEANVTLNSDGVSKQGMNVGGTDNKWKVTQAGTYKLVFDLTNHTITVAAFTPDAASNPWDTETLYLLGQAGTGWSIADALPFKKMADHKFVYAGELKTGSFKLMATNTGGFDTEDKDWFYAPANDTAIGEAGVATDDVVAGNHKSPDNKWKVTKAGNYVLTIDMNTHKISAEFVGETASSITTAEARLVGDATPTGWDITGSVMTKASSSPLEFTWQGKLKVGEFKVAITSTNNDFSGDWLQAPTANTTVNEAGIANGNVVKGGDDNKWKVTTAGTYKITINFSTRKINISYVGA